MPDIYFASTYAGVSQIAYLIANLHQLPVKGTHVGNGPHVDMPADYTPGKEHIGWSVRPYPYIRRLHPVLNSWGVLMRTETQTIWADPVVRAQRLVAGQIASFTDILPTGKALDAAWNAGVQQGERHSMGEGRIDKFGADPSGTGNSTVAIQQAIASAGPNGVISGPPGDYKVNPNSIIPLSGQDWQTGACRFFTSGPGDFLCYTNAICTLRGDWVGMNQVTDCIVADGSSLFFKGSARQATRHGLYLGKGLSDLDCEVADCGSHGVYFHGANGTKVWRLYSHGNAGLGFEAVGIFDPDAAAGDPTLTAGDIHVMGCQLESNALGAFRLRGVEGGHLFGVRCEGGGIGGHIKNSHNIGFTGWSHAGGVADPDSCFCLIENSNGIYLADLKNNPGAFPPYARIELRGDCHESTVVHARYFSDIASTKLPVVQEHVGSAGAITSSSNALTATGLAFVAGDVGRRIVVHGAGTSGGLLHTTVAAVTNGTQVTLSAVAATSVSGAAVRFYRPAVVS